MFADQDNVDVKLAEISAVDTAAKTVRSTDGEEGRPTALVLAAGSQPNFFHTPGAAEHSFPLYSLENATNLRSRILGVFEQVDRDPKLVKRGALNFVIVGGGPTGVEVAGALADMLAVTVPAEYQDIDMGAARIYLLDYGDALLKPFSDKAHGYAAKVLTERKVELRLGTGAKEIGPGHAKFSDGAVMATRCVIWGGGIMAAPVAGRLRPRPGTRRAARRAARPDARRQPRGVRGRRYRQHSRPRPQATSPARVRGAAERPDRREQHPRRFRGRVTSAVRLSRQGHHGDDRAPRGDRGGRQEPPRDTRTAGTHGVARSSRDPDDRGASQGRGDARLGVGPVQQDRRPARPGSRRSRQDRLGGRPRGSGIGSHRRPPDEQEPTKTAP